MWYHRVFSETDENRQLMIIAEACEFYMNEHASALRELDPPTGKIERMQSRIPGMTAHRYSQFQDLENLLAHVENMENRTRQKKIIWYTEHYNRTLSVRDAGTYADVSDDVQILREIRFRVSSVRNLYLAITKGLEHMHFQISNVTRMRVAGLDDATF